MNDKERHINKSNWINGKDHTLAGKEIISSAGTFGSAQLLMLSGIGPKRDLEALGVSFNKFTAERADWFESRKYFSLRYERVCIYPRESIWQIVHSAE